MDLDAPSPPPVASPTVSPSFTAPAAPPARSIPWLLIVIAFAIGLAVMALAVHYYDRWTAPAQPLAATGPATPGAVVTETVTPTEATTGTTYDAICARENELGGRIAVLQT